MMADQEARASSPRVVSTNAVYRPQLRIGCPTSCLLTIHPEPRSGEHCRAQWEFWTTSEGSCKTSDAQYGPVWPRQESSDQGGDVCIGRLEECRGLFV